MFDLFGGFMTFVLLLFVVYFFFQLRGNDGRIETLEKDLQYVRDKLTRLTATVERLKERGVVPPAGEAAAPQQPAAAPFSPSGATSIPPAGPVPPATPLPGASPIPAAAPMPGISGPLGIEAPEEDPEEDIAWGDETPAQTARPRPLPAGAGKTGAAKAPSLPREEGFEFQFGKKLPVWIGGIALALAGFYLVKYTIEKNLLTENVRIFLGLAFGLALAAAGRYIRVNRPDMADGRRIAQALTGAAIADLYATTYAAVSVWHVASPAVGFAGMALITCFAVVLSLRHGMSIAVLGLVGGYLTPMMVSSPNPSAVPLFVYLYFLIAGFFVLVRRQGWWALAIPVTLLGFLWVPAWIFGGHFSADDGLCLGLFVIATCATIAAQTGRAAAASAADAPKADNTATIAAAGGLAAMGLVTLQSDFGLVEWGMYWLLGLGGMAMAYFRPQVYRYIPALSLGLTLVLLAAWDTALDSTFAALLLCFAALYAGGSLVLYRWLQSFFWAGMLSASAMLFYLLGFARLRGSVYALLDIAPDHALHFWGAVAMVLALFFAGRTGGVYRNFAGAAQLKDRLLALFCLMTTGFLSLALVIEVHSHFLAVAFAGETLAVCWVYQRLGIPALRQIAGVLLGVFALLMAPQFLLLGAVALHSLFGFDAGGMGAVSSFLTEPFVQLGLPMAMLGLGSWLLRARHDGRMVEVFEYAAVALGALLAYYLSRLLFHVPADIMFRKAGFFERAVVTNVFFSIGMLLVYAGRLYARRALMIAGTLIFGMAMFRVFWFDVLIGNPLWSAQDVGNAPVVNNLLIAYGLPLLWLWTEAQPQLRIIAWPERLRGALALFLGFLLVNLEVRQAFHGADLRHGPTGNAETYSYSAAWLLMGVALLLAGTAKNLKDWRVASLILTTAAVGKVFLYDARALEGLFRVFSFMGLGVCMMALSWFYTRFVFNEKDSSHGTQAQ